MSNQFFHKPELALRRALELQGIHQSEAALSLLHDVLSSRRHRTWSPAYEQIMIAYLNLCLKLHRAREAKDGLHQYRNLAQAQAPGSLEKVIRYLLEKAEDQCSKAKAAVDAAAVAASEASTPLSILDDGDDDEGDGGIGPQTLLLSSMSTDPAKSQRDSLMLLPSLKFLWEIYRAVLDILRSNSKLEHVYHATAQSAFQFCREYSRRIEFRRLCELLRMHLGNLQKYGDDVSGKQNNKVRGWEGWSSESIELHLQTRFAQLETASSLKLYTEGFRTVEDISSIMTISNHRRKQNPDFPPPKAKLMAKYYEQLIELFWVSENYLFHAFAWYKYYILCKEYNKSMSEELKTQQASAVLLAALCIPSLPTKTDDGHGSSSTDNRFMDSVMQEKMSRMATLLNFNTRNPSRETLLEEINGQDIFSQVPDYLKDLYKLLEHGSDPLVLVRQGKPLLDQISPQAGADASSSLVGRYVQPLGNVLLLKLLWNLSSAYHTVKIDFIKELTDGLGMSFENVEKSIVLFTQTHKGLAVRIDHRAGCLRFGDAQLESDAMRSQLRVLGQQLEKVVASLSPDSSEAKEATRASIYQTVRDVRDAEHAKMLERKAHIEHRKEEIERLAQEKIKREQQQAAAEEAARRAEEERRIQREQQLREIEKKKKVEMELENDKKEKLLQALGYNTETMTAEQVAATDAEKLQKEHQDKINKKREEAERKTRDAAKQLDYLVRAIRIEELPLIKAKYDEKVKLDREEYEKEVVQKAQRAKEQWESDIKEKEILSNHNVFAYMKEFQEKAMEGRRLKYVVICSEADKEAELRAEKDKMKRARKRKQDEEKRIANEAARAKREEEERIAEEERRKKEEARRQREAEEEERRKQEAARMAEERERKDRQQEDRAPRSSRELDSAGTGGGGGKYVPPSRRGAGGGTRSDDRTGGGSRFGDRGIGGSSYPGGGRYEGRTDRRGAGSGGGSGYGGSDRGGGARDRREDGPPGDNSRWRR